MLTTEAASAARIPRAILGSGRRVSIIMECALSSYFANRAWLRARAECVVNAVLYPWHVAVSLW
jgi:hypothetical protein